jgi:hypothetical protein
MSSQTEEGFKPQVIQLVTANKEAAHPVTIATSIVTASLTKHQQIKITHC